MGPSHRSCRGDRTRTARLHCGRSLHGATLPPGACTPSAVWVTVVRPHPEWKHRLTWVPALGLLVHRTRLPQSRLAGACPGRATLAPSRCTPASLQTDLSLPTPGQLMLSQSQEDLAVEPSHCPCKGQTLTLSWTGPDGLRLSTHPAAAGSYEIITLVC